MSRPTDGIVSTSSHMQQDMFVVGPGARVRFSATITPQNPDPKIRDSLPCHTALKSLCFDACTTGRLASLAGYPSERASALPSAMLTEIKSPAKNSCFSSGSAKRNLHPAPEHLLLQRTNQFGNNKFRLLRFWREWWVMLLHFLVMFSHGAPISFSDV